MANTKVWCAAIECKHNDRNLCKAKEINLADGMIHTVHEGRRHVWTCRAFDLSEAAKELEAQLSRIMKEGPHGD